MTDPNQGRGVLSALAAVRASGRVYARKLRESEASAELLRVKVREAYAAGASVTELAEAAGISRHAIYTAVRGRRP